MCINNLNNKAFSLLEILLASIIFIITIAGVFVTLSAVRKPVADKESALTAAVFGKQVLEALRSSVNAQPASNFYGTCIGTCTDFSLALGTHQVNLPNGQLIMPPNLISSNGGGNGVLTYTVSCADDSPAPCTSPDVARKVELTINWPEAP